jgi:GT2 family glycosyltransferase
VDRVADIGRRWYRTWLADADDGWSKSGWQTRGGAIIVQAGQSSVTNKLVQSLIDCTPPLDSDIVIAVGATNIRSTFDEALLPGLFDAYMYGLETEFVLSIALSGCAVVVRAFTPWTKVEGKKLRSSA